MLEMSRLTVTLADKVSRNSYSAFNTDAFTAVSKKAERQNLHFSSENVEVYSRHFSMQELQDALRTAHDNSAGRD